MDIHTRAELQAILSKLETVASRLEVANGKMAALARRLDSVAKRIHREQKGTKVPVVPENTSSSGSIPAQLSFDFTHNQD